MPDADHADGRARAVITANTSHLPNLSAAGAVDRFKRPQPMAPLIETYVGFDPRGLDG
jgi:hypothetical protein